MKTRIDRRGQGQKLRNDAQRRAVIPQLLWYFRSGKPGDTIDNFDEIKIGTWLHVERMNDCRYFLDLAGTGLDVHIENGVVSVYRQIGGGLMFTTGGSAAGAGQDVRMQTKEQETAKHHE